MSDTWIKLDVDLPTHPKILEVGPIAGWAYVSILCYSRRYLTDGAVSYGAMHAAYTLIEHYVGQELANPEALASLLTDAGLLEANGNGWIIHDYAEHQQTKQKVQEQREALSRIRSQAGRKGGQASAEARRSKSKLEVEVEVDKNPPTPLASQSSKPRTPSPKEVPTMIDAVTACQHFIEGRAWDETFDEQAIREEFARIERGRRTEGTIGNALPGLLEQWAATRQDRYGIKANLTA